MKCHEDKERIFSKPEEIHERGKMAGVISFGPGFLHNLRT